MAFIDKFVSLYHFDGDAQDAIGSNHGDETFADYTTDAPIGSHAFLGDAVDNRIDIGDDLSLDFTTAMSAGCLIKPNASSGYSVKSLLNKQNSYFFAVGWPTVDKYAWNVRIAGTWRQAVASGVSLDISAYHAVIGTYDGLNVKIFVDGVLEGIVAQSGSITSVPAENVIIHAISPAGGSGHLDAKTDELFIANDALADGGVTTIGNPATGEVAEVTDRLLSGIALDAEIEVGLIRRGLGRGLNRGLGGGL